MPSKIERGAYGSTRKVVDWNNYNPMGLKIQPFKEEKVCALCESKCDVIFPMSPKLCGLCAQRVGGRDDVSVRFTQKLDIMGMHCEWCDRLTYRPIIVNTRVCNKCTIRLGNVTKERYNQMRYARKVGLGIG